MIQIYCIKCGKELDEPGAVLLSPPKDGLETPQGQSVIVLKYHICKGCYGLVVRWLTMVR